MKKGFGIFFAGCGILNILIGIAGLNSQFADKAGVKLIWGILFSIFGYWLISSSINNQNK